MAFLLRFVEEYCHAASMGEATRSETNTQSHDLDLMTNITHGQAAIQWKNDHREPK
jgi:hypothetical protein